METKMYSITWKLLLTLVTILHSGVCQENEIGDVEVPASKLENTVVSDMLRIVDHKFDTLTTRITALERAVSGLQYFSIRQFRQLSGNIQKTQKNFDNVNKKIGQLEVDGKGLKIAMSLLGGSVADLKATSSGILGELESSVVYINENVDKQAQTFKQKIEESQSRTEKMMEEHFTQQAQETARFRKAEGEKPLNCSVDFTALAERIDVRFAEFKQQTYVHCAKLINDARNKQEEAKRTDQKGSIDGDPKIPGPKTSQSSGQAAFSSSPEESYSQRKKDLLHKKLASKEGEASPRHNQNEVGYGEEYDDRIMQLLFNMTTSVLQATSYFRLSSRVMEEILSNTGMLVEDQANMKRDLGIIKVSLYNQNNTGLGKVRFANGQPGQFGDARQPSESGRRFYNPPWTGRRDLKECKLSVSALSGLETMVKNGSQLLEVLTDLAQMSSMSLTKATTSLQDEVNRVENFRTRMTSTILSKFKELKSNSASNPNNTKTQRVFDMVEAIASNTRWLPLILRDVQDIELMVNRSVYMTSGNNGLLQKIHQFQIAQEASAIAGENGPIDNRIYRVPPPAKNDLANKNAHSTDSTNSPSARGSQKEFVLDQKSFEMISRTSRQLHRIMPALTKLLAEPDPLITLVGGRRSDEGRLEIYNRGQWGTICHVDLSHQEANAVCRHLGFPGGISAGAGHFGSGTGIPWKINISCLDPAATCPIVKQLEDVSLCDHQQDVALICDHMLRISSGNDSVNNKIGRLEIHHKGLWLPICSEGWNDYAARVACQQMGFADGREVIQGEWQEGANSTWLSHVTCNGKETRLDACQHGGWLEGCNRSVPAGVRCH